MLDVNYFLSLLHKTDPYAGADERYMHPVWLEGSCGSCETVF